MLDMLFSAYIINAWIRMTTTIDKRKKKHPQHVAVLLSLNTVIREKIIILYIFKI